MYVEVRGISFDHEALLYRGEQETILVNCETGVSRCVSDVDIQKIDFSFSICEVFYRCVWLIAIMMEWVYQDRDVARCGEIPQIEIVTSTCTFCIHLS